MRARPDQVVIGKPLEDYVRAMILNLSRLPMPNSHHDGQLTAFKAVLERARAERRAVAVRRSK